MTVVLTLYTLILIFIFSTLSLYNNYGTDKENLFNIWEICKLVIISYNLMTFTFDPRVILQGEIRSQSPSGVKGFNYLHKQQIIISYIIAGVEAC